SAHRVFLCVCERRRERRGIGGVDHAPSIDVQGPEVDRQRQDAQQNKDDHCDERQRCSALVSMDGPEARSHSHRNTALTLRVNVAGFRPGTKGMLTLMLWFQLTVTSAPTVESVHCLSAVGEPGPIGYPTAESVTRWAINAF